MGTQDQLNAENRLSKDELLNIEGGTKISGTLVNAFTSAIKAIYSIGQDFGGAIRRIATKKLCKVSR